MKQLYNKLAK